MIDIFSTQIIVSYLLILVLTLFLIIIIIYGKLKCLITEYDIAFDVIKSLNKIIKSQDKIEITQNSAIKIQDEIIKNNELIMEKLVNSINKTKGDKL